MKHEVEKRGALVARSPWGSPQDTLEGNTRDSRRQTRVNHSCVWKDLTAGSQADLVDPEFSLYVRVAGIARETYGQ